MRGTLWKVAPPSLFTDRIGIDRARVSGRAPPGWAVRRCLAKGSMQARAALGSGAATGVARGNVALGFTAWRVLRAPGGANPLTMGGRYPHMGRLAHDRFQLFYDHPFTLFEVCPACDGREQIGHTRCVRCDGDCGHLEVFPSREALRAYVAGTGWPPAKA
jgi:hypothetical protein